MTLEEVRESLIEASGRYDLRSSAAGPDVDFYIRAGQRWLDRQLDFPKNAGELEITISNGDAVVTFERNRAVKEVAVKEDRWNYLKKRKFRDLRSEIPRASEADKAAPRYYAPGFEKREANPGKKKLLLWPPADQEYRVLIVALFESAALENSEDKSFWSVRFPDLLVQAAQMKLEIFQRNTRGVQDMKSTLLEELQSIDHDTVEEDIANIDQRLSTWRDIDF